MSERSLPTRAHLGRKILRNEAGEYLVCPECGEFVDCTRPVTWQRAWGPIPAFSHVIDGEPLCPVISTGDGVCGYVPANPVTRREFDDDNGCPCGSSGPCMCACTWCDCRALGIEPQGEAMSHG